MPKTNTTTVKPRRLVLPPVLRSALTELAAAEDQNVQSLVVCLIHEAIDRRLEQSRGRS